MLPQVRRLPHAPGVYRFRDASGRALYLGRATDLRSRVASYWSVLTGRRHLRRMIPAITRVEALTCASVHEAGWLERNLLEHRKLRWNRVAGGQESPVYIVLDAGPRRPGLHLSYTGGFGPYLGGTRARLALSALHRIHPLGYAGSAPTGAERDMAARRGVTPGHRARLAAAVGDVLRRDPGAVRDAEARLVALRDRAADELRFEHAARLQDEIQALDWLTSPQRVTVPGGGDHQVTGWSDGIQVAFEVRDGRLRTWRQRAATRAPQGPPPIQWAEFAQVNADLARFISD